MLPTPRTPSCHPLFAPPCDPRLAEAARLYRLNQNPPLTSPRLLGAFNITVWLYSDRTGQQRVRVDANTTIEELTRQFGPAETPDAEVGIHSEAKAAEWFSHNRGLRVLQIFSERIPCPKMCAPLLRHHFPNVPWYYYYDRRSWIGPNGNLIKYPAQILQTVYSL